MWWHLHESRFPKVGPINGRVGINRPTEKNEDLHKILMIEFWNLKSIDVIKGSFSLNDWFGTAWTIISCLIQGLQAKKNIRIQPELRFLKFWQITAWLNEPDEPVTSHSKAYIKKCPLKVCRKFSTKTAKGYQV